MNHEIESVAQQDPGYVPLDTILTALKAVLSSKPFRTSKQCQEFLRYVVVNSVRGNEELLKERVIGSEVLEREPDYNTSEDPVVRIRAADVRKRLAMYYQEEGRHASVRITIPPGSYRALFQASGDVSGPAEPSRVDPAPVEATTLAAVAGSAEQAAAHPAVPAATGWARRTSLVFRTMRVRKSAAGLAAALLLLLVGFFSWKARDAHSLFDLFWAPTIGAPHPPIIYVANYGVYVLKDSFLQRYQASHPDFRVDPTGFASFPHMDPKERLSFDDLDANDRDFVGLGDVASAVSISSMFRGKNVPFDLRFGKDMVFGDFTTTPVILIGAYNNAWTLDLNDRLPYRFAFRNNLHGIEGQGHFWQTKYQEGNVPREDYALITRQVSPKGGELVITVAGLDQTGTRGAAEFVANPALLDPALRRLPAGWQNKRVQLVLHVYLLDSVPSGEEVIASSVQ